VLQGTGCTYVNLDFEACGGKRKTLGQQEGGIWGILNLKRFFSTRGHVPGGKVHTD